VHRWNLRTAMLNEQADVLFGIYLCWRWKDARAQGWFANAHGSPTNCNLKSSLILNVRYASPSFQKNAVESLALSRLSSITEYEHEERTVSLSLSLI
jgi:hypothetical protein